MTLGSVRSWTQLRHAGHLLLWWGTASFDQGRWHSTSPHDSSWSFRHWDAIRRPLVAFFSASFGTALLPGLAETRSCGARVFIFHARQQVAAHWRPHRHREVIVTNIQAVSVQGLGPLKSSKLFNASDDWSALRGHSRHRAYVYVHLTIGTCCTPLLFCTLILFNCPKCFGLRSPQERS